MDNKNNIQDWINLKPNLPLWNNDDMCIAGFIGLCVGIIIGLVI